MLLAFCDQFGVTLENLLDKNFFSSENDDDRTIFEKPFGDILKSVFRDNISYDFNIENEKYLMESLSSNEKSAKLYFIFPPLENSSKDSSQQGEFIFTYTKQGFCSVTSTEYILTDGSIGKLRGGAILLNRGTPHGHCCCFLQSENNKGITAFMFIMFSIKGNYIWENPPDWNILVGSGLSVTISGGTPFLSKIILSKKKISDEDVKQFLPHIKLTLEDVNGDLEKLYKKLGYNQEK